MIGTTRSPYLFPLASLRSRNSGLKGVGPFFPPSLPFPPPMSWSITGVSRDSTGAALAGCTCTLFRVDTTGALARFTQPFAAVVSDGSGNFTFVVGSDGPWRVTFDLAGAPVRAGITLKNLAGT